MKELIKDLGKLIMHLLIFSSIIYLTFGAISLFGDYLSEKEVKDSNFCKKMNMSYYMVIDNGFASSKIICLDNNNTRQEYYFEEIYK